jgi:oligosaccharide repeat unit polymerase
MGDIQFYTLFIEHWNLYIYSFILCFIIYYFTFRNCYISLLDIFNFNLLYSFLGASVVFFLYFTGQIRSYYFFSYCFTQIAFTIGFFIFKPFSKYEIKVTFRKEIKIKDEYLFLQILFLVTSLSHIMCQLYVYILSGIPLFLDSYLETFTSGGGIGTFSRIITASTIISWYLLIHFFLNKKSKNLKFYLWFYFFTSLIFFTLSGSKGTFLITGLILFLYTLINSRYNLTIKKLSSNIEKFSLKLFIFIFITGIFIIIFKDNNGINPFLKLGIRLIHSGDAYFYGYPNDIIKELPQGNSFNALFSDLLGMFRIVDWKELPLPFGMTLFGYHNPLIDVVAGANARHNIYGLYYFGYIGAIIFSFILGIILSFSRNYLYRHLTCNTLFGLFYTMLYLSTITFESDINLGLFMLNSYILGFILVFIIAIFIFFMYKNTKLLKFKF